MMDCHILSAAHNATITGPKCRVCAAFTIEMRQSVGIEILIISFPRGLRAALQLGKEGDVRILRPFALAKKDKTSNSLVSTPISKWLLKKKANREQHSGERFVSVSAILVHLSAVHHGRNRQTWHAGHI